MRKDDIKPGRLYVIMPLRGRDNHLDRKQRTMDGEIGQVVKVLGVDTYSTKPSECGREVFVSDQHTRLSVHVKGKRRALWWMETGAMVEFDEIVAFPTILMTKKEWDTKHAAYVTEKARIQSAMDAHEADVQRAKRRIVRLLGADFDLTIYSHRTNEPVQVSMTGKQFRGLLGPVSLPAFDELVRLASIPRDEVIC